MNDYEVECHHTKHFPIITPYYNTKALHTHKSNNEEVETSHNWTPTTHNNLHAVDSEGQSKVRWRCIKWKEENISAVHW